MNYKLLFLATFSVFTLDVFSAAAGEDKEAFAFDAEAFMKASSRGDFKLALRAGRTYTAAFMNGEEGAKGTEVIARIDGDGELAEAFGAFGAATAFAHGVFVKTWQPAAKPATSVAVPATFAGRSFPLPYVGRAADSATAAVRNGAVQTTAALTVVELLRRMGIRLPSGK
jgi:hypothetical protein